jgi:hypothetical protein
MLICGLLYSVANKFGFKMLLLNISIKFYSGDRNLYWIVYYVILFVSFIMLGERERIV